MEGCAGQTAEKALPMENCTTFRSQPPAMYAARMTCAEHRAIASIQEVGRDARAQILL
jgi:hypothetical protein